MEPSLVSVIIPTFNCGPYISDALRSVLSQEVTSFEIIVIDDCSTDNTEQIVRAIAPQARYLRNKVNSGPSFSRNRGIDASRGTYVAFLDADDQWLPGKLAAQLNVFADFPDVILVAGQMVHWDSPIPQLCESYKVTRYEFKDLILRNYMATPTVVALREHVIAAGMFDEGLSISEDYDLWLRLSRRGVLTRCETPVARYRTRSDGASAGNAARTYKLALEYIKSLKARFPNESNIARLVQQNQAAFHLDYSIYLTEQQCYSQALKELLRSFVCWPWSSPVQGSTPLLRLRRTRRVLQNWFIESVGTLGIQKLRHD